MAEILVVDDERSIRNTLREILEYEKFKVEEAEDGQKALNILKKKSFDLMLCDIKMPKTDGMDLLELSMKIHPDMPVVMISGHGNIETAVDAIKAGAYDFIEKPIDLNRLLVTVRNALDKSSLVEETKTLRKKISGKKGSDIIGESKAINEVKEMIEKVAPTDARVLITGPNGTGKELVARQLHAHSERSKKPFVEVNCAAIPSELIESELFGHEKGAFTSAVKQRKGKFEQAEGGTLFLDEIGDMSLKAQAKVLRALQESKINRVGGDKDINVDVRVIAATNKNLKEEIEEKNFREDLYHRLSVILIEVPALNDRKEDIPLLTDHFLDSICKEQGIAKKSMDKKALDELQKHDFSGNIRELRNIIERLVILSGKSITASDVKKYC
ncbi:sigma-54-dependent transcriptional regulator [Salibacter halophilus]|uniref:Sigma-54-dependent Fis family transcriptional regulator n=1 Tax=Salibacter halophilus TaxID=1803916 RepID=A0A6N6MCH6_9FLAO|nr:sigma-54 dependent transcriptional regulator [Salibacter halophilus]KAB1066257.1 sigma-54-dependent Fis family transcriptional regulator [Salibacter halophilus]